MLIDRAAFLFVIEQIEIDGFVTNGKAEIGLDDMRDLLRAVVLFDQVENDLPLLSSEMGATPIPLPTGYRVLMRYGSGVGAAWASISD